MKTIVLSFSVALAMAGAAVADQHALQAFVNSINGKDKAGCMASFAEGATFIDVGADYSKRIEWFCNTVIDTNGRYTVLSTRTENDTTHWELSFLADNYRLEGKSTLRGGEGKIVHLVIEGGEARLGSPSYAMDFLKCPAIASAAGMIRAGSS